jgi:hypothetical protein
MFLLLLLSIAQNVHSSVQTSRDLIYNDLVQSTLTDLKLPYLTRVSTTWQYLQVFRGGYSKVSKHIIKKRKESLLAYCI